jgi:hypothetical protein
MHKDRDIEPSLFSFFFLKKKKKKKKTANKNMKLIKRHDILGSPLKKYGST